MRRLAEEEEDISEREAQAEAAAAAAGASAGAESGHGQDEEALLRMPLRAGAAPPTYGGAGKAAAVGPHALPFLKWPSAVDRSSDSSNANGDIGLGPMPSQYEAGADARLV